ncbi:MAG: hypothetical protein U5K71_01045 [Gracilimonas sp.]|nr:hypothetical protein [Gracilimonas sp.]
MRPFARNILALIIGLVVGGFVNMGIIMISGSIIPPPDGAIVTTMEGLQESLHLFQPRHFLMPFLAHALGTLFGAFITALIAAKDNMRWGMGVGAFFLIGGIANVIALPAPIWFNILDLAVAYLPMAWIGVKLIEQFKTGKSS